MRSERLILACETGLFVPPDVGRIAVFDPPIEADLACLPQSQVEVVTRDFPTSKAFAARGYRTETAPKGPYALSIIHLRRAKAASRAIIAAASAVTDGPLVIDGAKTMGVGSILKAVRDKTEISGLLTKAHGKLFVAEQADFSDWAPPPYTQLESGFVTAPGVFSADGVDPGSLELVQALPERLNGVVVDLGAGWGYLADAALTRGADEVHLVEADHGALAAARQNIEAAHAVFHWADALDFELDRPVDHILCNPPFHTTRKADPALGQAFIASAARLLARSGTLWLVANRHLPYEDILNKKFREVSALPGSPQFKLFRARKPRAELKRMARTQTRA